MLVEKIAYLIIGAATAVTLMTVLPVEDSTNVRVKGEVSSQLDAMSLHQHPLREVAENLPTPTVNHLMFPDVMGGYNVQIMTRNFTFTPAKINQAVEQNAGHAHIYVNGVKYARVYGKWFHLPSSALTLGDNLIKVTLNGNDHSEWAKDGEAISSTVIMVRKQ
ncbi:hypothetical protein [Marinomonas epiphytica]